VFGGGLAITAVGGLVELKAANDMDRYDGAVTRGCSGSPCAAVAVDQGLRSRATVENRLAIGSIAAGVVAAAAGAALLHMNRARPGYELTGSNISPAAG
jgi:hypothetical protein